MKTNTLSRLTIILPLLTQSLIMSNSDLNNNSTSTNDIQHSENTLYDKNLTDIVDYDETALFSNNNRMNILINFAKKMVNDSIPLDPNIAKAIKNNFWELF